MNMMSMEEQIQTLIDKFHRKMEKDEAARKDVEHLKKTFNIDLGEEGYSLKLEHAKVVEFNKTLDSSADVTVITTPESLSALISGELRPMKAYVMKKIKIQGNIQDLMFLKKFF